MVIKIQQKPTEDIVKNSYISKNIKNENKN